MTTNDQTPTTRKQEMAASLLDEAENEMKVLDIDPRSPAAFMELALVLLHDRRQLAGHPKHDDPDIIEVGKESHTRVRQFARRFELMIHQLKDVEGSYLEIDRPGPRDVLEHAQAALTVISGALEPFGISKVSAIPTALLLVEADLINILQGKNGRLWSLPERDERHHDSPGDRCRLVALAYATDAIRRLCLDGRSQAQAARDVAKTLEDAGLMAPGGKKSYKASTLVREFRKAKMGTASFSPEYDRAIESQLDMSAGEVLNHLQNSINLLTIYRE